MAKSNVISAEIPPGALISFVQKGLQYVGIEAHVNEDGTERDCDGDLSLLSPHICHIAQSGTRGVGFPSSAVSNAGAKRKRTTSDVVTTTTSPTNNNNHNNDGDGGSVPFNVHPSKNITLLRGHTAEVFTCSWSPKERSVLVSSSGDSTARIWNVANVEKNNMPIILHHMKDSDPSKPPSSGGDDHLKNSTNLSQYKRDVTTIKWNTNGTHVASGSYDGVGRIWTQAGALVQTLRRHQGPIFSMKWNPSSTYLLSGSYDKSVIVWNAETGEMKQHFQCHAAPALDVDWRDDETFASCSTDKTIHLCRIGTPGPVMTFVGHQDEVNTIKWNPAKTLLASCSDDHTARVWSPDSSSCIQNFSEHDKEIYIIQWNPSGTTLATYVLVSATESIYLTMMTIQRTESLYLNIIIQLSESIYICEISKYG